MPRFPILFPSLRARRVSARYSQEGLPDIQQRINDALYLEGLGFVAALGVDCIQPRNHAQALAEERHDRKGEIHGIIGPLVYINYEESRAFAPPGAALWQRNK